MASAQLDTVKRVVELFNALPADRDARASSPELTELVGLFDPEVEFRQSAALLDGLAAQETHRGRRSFQEAWEDWISAWEGHRSEVVEIVERSARVLVLSRDRLRARDGLEVENHGGLIFTFGQGKIVRADSFIDHETARRAFEAGGSAQTDM